MMKFSNIVITEKLKQRFWDNVDKTDNEIQCWEWKKSKTKLGYGKFSICKKQWVRAHRMAYFLSNQDPDDLFVCHKCDNPSCCNPLHLFLGTCKDNTLDMLEKGRSAIGDKNGTHTHPESFRGEKNGNSKLKNFQIQEIFKYHSFGLSQQAIANKFNVSQATVQGILSGKNWTHVS